MTNDWTKPTVVNGLDANFGAKREDLSRFLPKEADIPSHFWSFSNRWHRFAEKWFFHGLHRELAKGSIKAKDGVDLSQALAHVSTVLRTFDCRHEHKIAGAAYLCSLWLEEEV